MTGLRSLVALGFALLSAFGQTTLNVSEDLVWLGSASTNMAPNEPTLI